MRWRLSLTRMVQLADGDIGTADDELGPADVMHVSVGTEKAIIPNFAISKSVCWNWVTHSSFLRERGYSQPWMCCTSARATAGLVSARSTFLPNR